MGAEKTELTDWAAKEREADLDWIEENLHIFIPVAQSEYDENGRGAIIVNASERAEGKGHPFGYLPQANIEEFEDEEVIRMVREYDPKQELVIVLLKPKNRESTYRVLTGDQGST